MNGWTAIYGMLTLVFVGATFLRRSPKDHALIAAGLLAAAWCVSALVLPHAPPWLIVWPAVDAVTVGVMAVLYNRRHERWKLFVLIALLLQCILHANYWIVTLIYGQLEYAHLWRYEAAVNFLFVVQLVSVGGPGIWNVASRLILGGRPVRALGRVAPSKGRR